MISEADARAAVDPGEHRETAVVPATLETIALTSTPVLPAFDRAVAVLTNVSDQVIWVRFAATGAVVGQGLPINPDETATITGYQGPLCAICTTGGKNLSVIAW